MKLIVFLFLVLLSTAATSKVAGQEISHALPKFIKSSDKYLFYLHGGVVTSRGNNGVNPSRPEWGPYEYLNILDSLRSRDLTSLTKTGSQI